MSRASVSMVGQEEVKVHCYLNHYVMYKTVMGHCTGIFI